MGLLDAYFSGQPLSSDPDKASAADGALWSLAAGLIGGRGAAGPIIGNAVQGAMGTYQGLLGDALKRQYVQSQIAENASQAEMRKAQMAQAQRQQTMQEDFLRSLGIGPSPGGGAAPLAAPAAPQAGGGAPGPMPPQAGADRFLGVPNAAAGADIAFNKGQGLGGMIAKGAEPKLEVHGGEVRDMRNMQPGTLIDQIDRQGRVIRGVRNPDGSVSYQPAPGSLDTYGQFEDRNARASASFKVQPVTGPDGKTRLMTEAQIADKAQRGDDPSAAGQNASGSTIAPSVASAPQQPMPAALEAEFRAAMQAASSTDPNTKLKGLSAAHNIAAKARQMGYSLPGDTGAPPQVPDSQMSPRGPAMPGVEVQSPAAAARAETLAKGQAARIVDREKSIAEGGAAAANNMAQINRAEQLFAGLDGGRLTPLAGEVASMAASLGFKIDPKWDAAQAASALAEKMANQMKPAGSGAVSDADLASFQRQVPTLSKTPEGRRQIFATMRAFAEREARVAQMARDYRSLKGSLDDEFDTRLSEWMARNPLRF